jgi:hypothetical protein
MRLIRLEASFPLPILYFPDQAAGSTPLRLLLGSVFSLLLLLLVSGACATSPSSSTEPALRHWPDTIFVPEQGVDADLVKALAAAGRREFVPVLVELLRFREGHTPEVIAALHTLSGQAFGDDWLQWVEWLGRHNIVPPAGFDAWKSALLALIDPHFQDFLYTEVPSRIQLAEVVWGGVRKDGIPALVNPPFIAASEATYLSDQELVFGLAIHGDARAYPHRILDWHEMANDVVGGVPIALTY